MNTFEEYLDKLQKTIGFKFKPIRWFATNLQHKFKDKIESYQKALEITRSWWNEKGSKALRAAKPPEVEIFSELRKDKDKSFYGAIYLVKDSSDPINDKDKKTILDVIKKYGALRDLPFKEKKYKNGKIVYKTIFTFTKDKNHGVWINRFKHNVVDEIRSLLPDYAVSSRIPRWLYDTDLQENNNMKTNTICEETKYTMDDVADALEGEDLKKAYGILFEMRYSEKDAEDLVNSYFYGDSWAGANESKQVLTEAYDKMPSGADLEPALSQEVDDPEKVKEILAAVDSLAKNQAARERLLEMFLDEDHTGFIRGFGELFEVPYDDEDQIMYRWLELVEDDPRAALMYQFENVGVEIFDDVLQVAGGVKEAEVIKEEGEESALPAVPESPDQLVAKIVEIRGKIDAVAKNVANIQAYCANHTDQREINDLTVDLNSGVQDAIEALDDIITAAGDQKKEDKKAAVDAIDQIA